MTDANSDREAGAEAGQRMNRVLQAERDAKRAIAECEQRAQEILQAAQVRAQRLVSRADQRITVIQMRCNHRIDSDVKAIEKQQQEPAGAAHPSRAGEQTIKAVLAAVAADLTGAGAGDGARGARRRRE